MLINPYYLQIASFILINILLGISIYITLATGQLSLGNAGFMSIGAYTSALLTTKLGVPIPIGMMIGALLAGLFGILIGIPTLRLHGVYLAIATLGFGEVVRVIFINWESMTSGAVGVAGIPHLGRTILAGVQKQGFSPETWGLKNNEFTGLVVFLILLLITLLVIVFFARLNRSRVGRAFQAIRQDEKAASAMGINTTYYKILTFSQGAVLAGFAGALFAHVTGYISPADFTYHRAVEILVFAVFGGGEILWGPIFGATFLTIMPEMLRSLSEYRYMIYGAVLVLMMVFRPQGFIDADLILRLKGKKKEKVYAA
ncbi:MAG TPA: branched-chain amino acid ABC transporter permease [Thermodesulfobacteriota bacterium]|nr:branched-chain amino acid ABC transporter permease [Thermodesulfobacteriota bacterium]